ncbi:hypothetical protein PG994_014486 [Apiospora phragmitis]|uniref:DUF7918 domain-containing protein n=1 Tax=Apiospora phragmitis TaxID=2905665 RepID=A0ABR1T6H9_9PEZI
MAILDHDDLARAIKVTVVVAGENATEYEDPEKRQSMPRPRPFPLTSCYIESRDDARFPIGIEIGPEYDWDTMYHDLLLEICIDGKPPTGFLIKRGSTIKIINGLAYADQASGNIKLTPFKFFSDKTESTWQWTYDSCETPAENRDPAGRIAGLVVGLMELDVD